MEELVKLVVFVPEDSANAVRQAMGDAGAGKIGNYSHCSFTTKGTGRFVPRKGADPAVGEIGSLTEVAEERIEVACLKEQVQTIIKAIKAIHPYEEIAVDIYPMLVIDNES